MDKYSMPILNERAKTHGEFNLVAITAQALKAAVLRTRRSTMNAEHAEALDMICTKIARICCGNPNEVDHWQDIAGYATLVADSLRPKTPHGLSVESAKIPESRPWAAVFTTRTESDAKMVLESVHKQTGFRGHVQRIEDNQPTTTPTDKPSKACWALTHTCENEGCARALLDKINRFNIPIGFFVRKIKILED